MDSLRRRFEQNQKDSSFTVAALLSSLTDPIMKHLPVEEITRELQSKQRAQSGILTDEMPVSDVVSVASSAVTDEGGCKVRSKKEMWDEIKIISITRAVSLIYAISLLVFFTRLQLNLLGRKNYLDSVLSLSEEIDPVEEYDVKIADQEEKDIIDNEVNRRFLTYSWWLLNNGWRKLVDTVKKATADAFKEYVPPIFVISFFLVSLLMINIVLHRDRSSRTPI